MNNYDFAELLSPTRFEQLSRDLLKSQYGNFENFSEGVDGGIDFRYSTSKSNSLIVQCKRYKKNNARSLINGLKKEVQKLDKLNLTDYLLVTSVDLTPSNKDEILDIFKGYINNPNQIITRSDLNDWLGEKKNEYVEFKYPELWMKSINIHKRIFQIGFIKHSEFVKTNLQKALINFVPHNDFEKVLNHLQDENTAIVSGIPGIGKTTIAYAVISHFIYFKNYNLVDVSNRSIQQAEEFLYSSEPTIFLIDDFLGRIALEKKSSYSDLLSYFIQKVDELPDKKLIITTREYILKKAEKEHFSINDILLYSKKYLIELGTLTRRVRIKIFHNHLKNSNLDKLFLNNLLHNDIKIIIDHKNYNPRIIEHLTNLKLLKNTKSDDYYTFFLENLNDSSRIWKQVYDNLPNDLYRITLFYIFLMDTPVNVEVLEDTIQSLILNSNKFSHHSIEEFDTIIKELEGTFFTYSKGFDEILQKQLILIDFQNPSIRDFINSFLWKQRIWLQILIENAKYYEQLFNFDLLDIIDYNDYLKKLFKQKVISSFSELKCGSFDYFDYEYEDFTFLSDPKRAYRYYLNRLQGVFHITKDAKIADFMSKEIFRYRLEEWDDISEKDCFISICEELLEIDKVSVDTVISNYLRSIGVHRKELVIFQHFCRKYGDNLNSHLKNNMEIIEICDEMFLFDLEEEEDDLSAWFLLEYYEDYHRVKQIMPLEKTTRKLKQLEKEGATQKYLTQFIEDAEKVIIQKEDEKEDDNYHDINDSEIDNMFNNFNWEI